MRRGLWIALLASAGAAVAVGLGEHGGPDVVVEPVHQRARSASPAEPPAAARWVEATAAPDSASTAPPGRERPAAEGPRGPWPTLTQQAAAAWSAPPPPAPAPAASVPAGPPPAPAFPYQWLGQLEDAGQRQAFLGSASRTLVLREGELLDAAWRLERVEPARLTFTWLASGETVHVQAGAGLGAGRRPAAPTP